MANDYIAGQAFLGDMEYTIFCGGVVGEEWRRAVVGDDDVVIGHDNVLSEDCFRVRALPAPPIAPPRAERDWWG